ncbi:sigma-70 family RNA polymerase sigma factor [Luteococcus sp. H138]|uniref:RNA polymerase sigma factor n=1 Tax=unclassified Luteococcus TaxID=2639923 RepID=UPI00313B62BB
MHGEQDFEQFARDITPGLFRRARLLLHDRQLAEDLVQDCLARVYRSRATLDEQSNPEGYAHKVLFNLFLESRRRRSNTEVVTAQVDDHQVPDPADAVTRRVALDRALAALGDEERVAVVARYLDDRPAREVAAMLGRSEPWSAPPVTEPSPNFAPSPMTSRRYCDEHH